MGFDLNSIPGSVLREMALGFQSEMEAHADSVCTIFDATTTLAGTLPYMLSSFTLARTDGQDLAPGAQMKPHNGGASSVSYNCLRQQGHATVPDELNHDLSVYGIDAIAEYSKTTVRDANACVDSKLNTVLTSTSLNNSYDVSGGAGQWDDNGAASVPFEDIRDNIKTYCPGADMILMGYDVANALLAHPDFFAEISNFNAGSADEGALERLLKAKVRGIREVHILDKFIDGANYGATTEAHSYVFDGLFWAGHKSDLIMIDPRGEINNTAEIERSANRAAYDLYYRRFIDIKRPHKEGGLVFTNVLAG